MYLNLEGDWTVTLTTKEGTQKGKVSLPGIIQAQGYGEKITKQTPWVSSLHDAEWWDREGIALVCQRGEWRQYGDQR